MKTNKQGRPKPSTVRRAQKRKQAGITRPRYRVVNVDGTPGPEFEFATLAAIWIASQKDMSQWRWEAVQ